MKTVQLAIRDSDYAQLLRNLLLRDGMHRVYLVDRPDLQLDGVIVIDESGFQNVTLHDSEPDRFVVITRNGTDHLSRVWDAGIRHVVFEEDPANTAQLAIIAAELRLPRGASVARTAKPTESQPVRHHSIAPPELPVLGSPERCRRCGHRNALTGF
jgi:hypothetical protein